MQTFPSIRYLRRFAAAQGELLQHPLELDGETVMCVDAEQADLIRRLYEAWTQHDVPTHSFDTTNATRS